MSVRRYLYAGGANALALPLLPLLLSQGRQARRNTPRLPEAAGARSGLIQIAGAAASLRLLAIGESPVAGVGVATQQEAITCRLASALAQHSGHDVHWQALGENGATVGKALRTLAPQLPATAQDVVLLAFGVNDTSAFHSARRFATDLQQLIDLVRQQCQPRLLLLSGVPPVHHLHALPQPLRSILGLKAAALNQMAREVAAQSGLQYAPLALDVQQSGLLASDGFHPSAKGVALWADALAQQVWPLLRSRA